MEARPKVSRLSAGSSSKSSWLSGLPWAAALTRLPVNIARGLIRAYQLTLSPFIGNQCRFHPSCSNYAMEAVEFHGAVKGSWLAIRRIGRCHPYNPGGFDPVPQRCSVRCQPDAGYAAQPAETALTPRTLVPGSKEI